MASGKITVKGADEVQRTLRKLAKDLEHMDEPARDGAELVRSAAQGFSRVRSGAMRASIRVEATSEGARVTAGQGIASPYPVVQEYGSRRRGISPNRYMARALEATEPRVVETVDDAVSRAVDNVKGA